MKMKCVIFGITDFGRMLRYYIEKYTGVEISAFSCDKKYMTENMFDGLPVVEFENIENVYSPQDYSMIIGIGYSSMNELRKRKFQEAKNKGYRLENFIHPTVVNECRKMGEGNIIFENVTLAYGTEIGDGNIIWNGCQISHETVIGNFNYIAVSCVLAGKPIIKNNCFLGINCAVQGKTILNDYTLIGAECFVKENTKEYSVYVPARSICLENKKSIDMPYVRKE